AVADDDLVGDGVHDVGAANAAADGIGQAHLDLFAAIYDAARNSLRRSAVVGGDDHVLGDVGQLASEVTAVGRLEGRVSQALTRPVCRAEVLEHREPFAEVGLDGGLDDFAVGLGHEAAHPGKLADL